MLSNPTDEAAWGSGKGPSLAALGLCLRVDYWIGRYRNERCETVSEWGDRDLWAEPSVPPSQDRQLVLSRVLGG